MGTHRQRESLLDYADSCQPGWQRVRRFDPNPGIERLFKVTQLREAMPCLQEKHHYSWVK